MKEQSQDYKIPKIVAIALVVLEISRRKEIANLVVKSWMVIKVQGLSKVALTNLHSIQQSAETIALGARPPATVALRLLKDPVGNKKSRLTD